VAESAILAAGERAWADAKMQPIFKELGIRIDVNEFMAAFRLMSDDNVELVFHLVPGVIDSG
jgi:hypothetical protein